MTKQTKRRDPERSTGGAEAGIAIASIWLVLYLAILVVTFVDQPGAAIDVASAAANR
jgi:hypothetical protein